MSAGAGPTPEPTLFAVLIELGALVFWGAVALFLFVWTYQRFLGAIGGEPSARSIRNLGGLVLGLAAIGGLFVFLETFRAVVFLALLGCVMFLLPAWTGRRFRAAADTWASGRSVLNMLGFYLGVYVLARWWALLLSVVVVHGVDISAVFMLVMSALLTVPAFLQARKPKPLPM